MLQIKLKHLIGFVSLIAVVCWFLRRDPRVRQLHRDLQFPKSAKIFVLDRPEPQWVLGYADDRGKVFTLFFANCGESTGQQRWRIPVFTGSGSSDIEFDFVMSTEMDHRPTNQEIEMFCEEWDFACPGAYSK